MKPPLQRTDSLAWMDRAACLRPDVEPEIFFPVGATDQAVEAKAVCATCPVRKDCDDYARTNGMEFGVWGGNTEEERRAARMAARPDRPDRQKRPNDPTWDVRCGTEAGVGVHRRKREALCVPCRKANNAAKQRARVRKREEANR